MYAGAKGRILQQKLPAELLTRVLQHLTPAPIPRHCPWPLHPSEDLGLHWTFPSLQTQQ